MRPCQRLITDEYHAYDERIVNERVMDTYLCPCKDCLFGKVRKRNVIYRHMLRYGYSGICPQDDNYYEDTIELPSIIN